MNFDLETQKFQQIVMVCGIIAEKNNVEPITDIGLKWCNRLTRTVGIAHIDEDFIQLSKQLWPHYAKTQQTMVHEVAHFYAEREKLNANHGPVWKSG